MSNTSQLKILTYVQLDNGLGYHVVESVDRVAQYINDTMIREETFLKLHFDDGVELNVRKGTICAYFKDKKMED